MQPGALSQINNFRSYIVSWSICLLATTIWNSLHTDITSLIRSIYFYGSYNVMGQRRKQGLLDSACIAIATTTTASIAHVLWYRYFSRSGLLGAVSFGEYSISCLITWFGLIFSRGFLGISYNHSMKPASKTISSGAQILYPILLPNIWIFFFHHEWLTQADNNDTEVPLLSEFLYFNLCLAIFALLLHWLPSTTHENFRYYIMGLKED